MVTVIALFEGYHTAWSLPAGQLHGDGLVMPQRYHADVRGRYFNDCFVFYAATDIKIAAMRLDFLQYEVVAGIPSLADQVKLTIMTV